jgi:death-on-curing protein
VRFLSSEQVVAMHAELLKRWGGAEGGGPRGVEHEGVEAAVQAVKNSYYESREELAAAYAVYIVQGHVFLDGNKRTGAAAMLTFLLANGGQTRRSSNEVARAMLELQARAEAGERTDQLVSWLSTLLSR